MHIDKTFFNGLLFIPNVTEPEPNNRSANFLDELIELYEYEVLSFAFGVEMFEDYKDKFETDVFYREIVDGKTYQKDGKTLIWKGLVQTTPIKKSLLADYVYCKYQTYNITQQTEFGQISADVKTGQKASSTPKIVKAWNDFLMKLQGNCKTSDLTADGNHFYLVSNRLGNGCGVSYFVSNETQCGEVSLMQFLHDNKENYPLFDDTKRMLPLEFKNSFGI